MRNVKRFNDIADIYDNFRPKYSGLKTAVDFIKFNKNMTIADIGSGTGILTSQLSKLGIFKEIYAVEPNDEMLHISKNKLKKNIIHINRESSYIPEIKNNKVDIIFVAQAIHWMEPNNTKKEFKRILKKNGYIFILNNTYDNAYQTQIHQIYKKIPQLKNNSSKYKTNAETFSNNFHVFKSYVVKNMAMDKFIGLNLSQSRAPRPGTKYYDIFISELKNIFNDHKNKNNKISNKINTSIRIVQIK